MTSATSIHRHIAIAAGHPQAGMSWGCQVTAWLLVGAYFLRASSFGVGLPLEQCCYAALLIATMYHLLSRGNQTNALVLVGLLATSFSVATSLNVRESLVRWAGWLLVMSACGGLFIGTSVRAFRQKAVEASLWCIHVMVWASMFVAVAGIHLFGRGVFWGVMTHSQILGAVAALSALDALRRGLVSGHKRWGLAFLVAVVIALMAASRSALLGLAAGSVPIAKMTGARGTCFVACVAVLGVFSSLFFVDGKRFSALLQWRNADTASTRGLLEKGMEDSRGRLWQERLNEFRSAPISGVGFSLGGREALGVPDSSLMEEPGSGYLALLSTTGVVGVCGVLLILKQLLATLCHYWNTIPLEARIFIASWGLFWAAHLAFEGYAVAVGSLFCPLLWMFLGYALDQSTAYVKVPDSSFERTSA